MRCPRPCCEEIAQLQPWHDIAARRRGGSTVGVSGMTATQAGEFVAAMLSDRPPQAGPNGEPLPVALKLACDDLRAFYEEAAAGAAGRDCRRRRWATGITGRPLPATFLPRRIGRFLRAPTRRCASSPNG